MHNNDYKDNIPFIVALRENCLSQGALAKKTGINRWYINMIISGRYNPSSEQKKTIADALNSTTEIIFGD